MGWRAARNISGGIFDPKRFRRPANAAPAGPWSRFPILVFWFTYLERPPTKSAQRLEFPPGDLDAALRHPADLPLSAAPIWVSTCSASKGAPITATALTMSQLPRRRQHRRSAEAVATSSCAASCPAAIAARRRRRPDVAGQALAERAFALAEAGEVEAQNPDAPLGQRPADPYRRQRGLVAGEAMSEHGPGAAPSASPVSSTPDSSRPPALTKSKSTAVMAQRYSGFGWSKRSPLSHALFWLPCAGMPPASFSMRAMCIRFQAMKVVLRWVNSLSSPTLPSSP